MLTTRVKANLLFTYLGNIEEPQQVGHRGVLGVIRGAWEDGVTIAVREHEGLNAHVRAQDDLRIKASTNGTSERVAARGA